MEGLVNQFDFDVLLGTQVFLNFFLCLVPHVVFHAEVETQFFVLLMDVMGQTIDFDVLEFFEGLDFFKQLLYPDILIVLALKEL